MGLPSSSGIDLDQIYDEAVSAGYTGAKNMVSLATWNEWYNGPDGNLPHGMVEFYGASAGRVSALSVGIGAAQNSNIGLGNTHLQKPINHGEGYVVGVVQQGQGSAKRRAFVVHEQDGVLTTSYIILGVVDQSSSYTSAVAAANDSYFLVCSTYEATHASANDTIGIWCVERNGTTLTENSSISYTDGVSMLCIDMCYLGSDATNDYYLVCYCRSNALKIKAVIVNKSNLSMSFGSTNTVDSASSQIFNAKVTITATKNNGSMGHFTILIHATGTNNYYPNCTYTMGSDSYAISALDDLPESSNTLTSRFSTSTWEQLILRGVSHPDVSAELNDQAMIFMSSETTSTSSTIAKVMYRELATTTHFESSVAVDASSDSVLANGTHSDIRCSYNLLGTEDLCVVFTWLSESTGALVVKAHLLVQGVTVLVPSSTIFSSATAEMGNEIGLNITPVRKNKFLLTWRDRDQSGMKFMTLVTITPS